MSTARAPASSSAAAQPPTPSYFDQQRELLIKEIALSFEHVLANINNLNRSLEGVIAVGNEFSSVEALWSQFEHVMEKDPEAGEAAEAQDDDEDEEEQREDDGEGEGEEADKPTMESEREGKARNDSRH